MKYMLQFTGLYYLLLFKYTHTTSMTKKIFAAIVLSTLAIAPFAHAEGGLLKSDTQVKATLPGGTQVGTTNHIVASTTATPVKGVRFEGGVNTSGGIKMEDGSERDTESSGEMSATAKSGNDIEDSEGDEEGEADVLEKAELHIDLDGDETGETEVDSAGKVRSETDFKGFVKHHAKADANLKSVDVKDGKVEVEYDEDAKLFGFIPAAVTAYINADATGNVEVSYPWYHIFMSKAHASDELEADIESAVSAKIASHKSGVASTSSGTTTTAKAALSVSDLFELIITSLGKSSASVNASGKANVD